MFKFTSLVVSFDRLFWSWIARYTHVLVGIMWIGLLWYFNFVQIPNMAKIPDEQKPAIGKVIAPTKSEAGFDLDYKWQVPLAEYWIKKNLKK